MRRSTTTTATPAEGDSGPSAAPTPHRDGWRDAWDAETAALLMDDLLTDGPAAARAMDALSIDRIDRIDRLPTGPLAACLLTLDLLTDSLEAASTTGPMVAGLLTDGLSPTSLLTAQLLTDGPERTDSNKTSDI